MSRNVANQIAQDYEGSAYYKRHHGQFGKICAYNQIVIFLWFIGHQTASFQDISDRFNISLSSLEKIIQKISVYLSNRAPQVICWPNDEEKERSEEDFRTNGFPNIIGAIDGSHIKIDKPEEDPDSYRGRNKFYSIHIQAVCDRNCKILDVLIGYPGSVHDSRVFRNSTLSQTLAEKCGQYHILGDSGYPLMPNLLTPFRDRGQLTNIQSNYNVQLSKNRYVIEHCFGILKQKFRQLYHCKLRKVESIVHLIRAACVLHNLALEDDFNVEEEEDQEAGAAANPQEDDVDDEDLDGDRNAQGHRLQIANMLYINDN